MNREISIHDLNPADIVELKSGSQAQIEFGEQDDGTGEWTFAGYSLTRGCDTFFRARDIARVVRSVHERE